MGLEDQKEEREVLDSIFPDEIQDVSETEYRISIKLDVPGQDEEEDESPIMLLSVQYPPEYPDVPPNLDLSNPPNAPRYPHLDIAEDKDSLLSSLTSTIEENIGIAMIFTLVSTLKESAEQLIAERAGAEQAEKDKEAAAAEEAENAKFHGTAVTRESFLKWRDAFVMEMKQAEERREAEREAEELKKRRGAAGPKEENKLTGKQLWERGLAGRGEDSGEEDGEDGVGLGMEKLKVES